MAVAVSVKLYADWNNDGDFADANEDISAYLMAASIRRGRSAVNDQFAPGSLQITLRNDSGLFSPFNSGGALYNSLLPGRAVKLEVVHSAVTYPAFYGYITDYQQSRSPDASPTVVINALDGFDILRFGEIRTTLQEAKRVDELITVCLDAAGWSATLRDLDTAIETLDQFWQHRATPLDAIRMAAKQELGGQLFMSRAGTVTFRNRYARSSAALLTTLTGPQALGFEVRREQLYDEVHHSYAGLDVATGATVLYTLTPTGRRINPGSTDPLNTIHGEYAVGGKNIVTPVATTDYTANSQADGSGTDMTAQVTVDSFTTYGGGFSIRFANADSSPVYITLLQVRGQAVRLANDERKIEVVAAAPVLAGQVLTDSFDYNNSASRVKAYAQYRAAVFSQIQPRPTVRVIPSTDAMMITVLSAELGSKVRVTNTTGLYPTQMDATCFIENINLSFSPGVIVDCSWGLFQRDQAEGSYFRISGAAGGGADYSIIGDATSGGYDRIAV